MFGLMRIFERNLRIYSTNKYELVSDGYIISGLQKLHPAALSSILSLLNVHKLIF